jgi:hypothetical protein
MQDKQTEGLIPVGSTMPTKTTRGRGKSKTAKAKENADAVAPNSFDLTIKRVQSEVHEAEKFAADIETAAVAYVADVLEAVPANIHVEVARRLQDSDPADFPTFANNLRESPAAREFFAMVAPESDADRDE